MRPLSPRRSAIVAALDIGTSKVTCLIGRLKPLAEDEAMRGRSHAVEVIGFGHTRAHGLKAGVIADLAPAEEAIRNAVDIAERAAGMEIAAVVVAFGGGRLSSESFAASVRLHGPRVEEGDIGRVLDARVFTRYAAAAPCCIRSRAPTGSIRRAAFSTRAGCSAKFFPSICM